MLYISRQSQMIQISNLNALSLQASCLTSWPLGPEHVCVNLIFINWWRWRQI